MEFEEILFTFIDDFKFLYYPEELNKIFLDYSKNELFVILYLYRYKESNMSKIAEYIKAPLNTATGIIDRLLKKGLVSRIQSQQDRRIVLIKLTNKAEEIIKIEKSIFEKYFERIFNELTNEEKVVVLNIFEKMKKIFASSEEYREDKNIRRIRRINIE